MKRRDFLRFATSSLVLPVTLDGYGARVFSQPSPFLRALMNVADQTDRVLVVVQMQGGNDGLNTVIPLDQMSVYTAPNFRGNIAIPEAKVLKLKNRTDAGLHPAMTGFQRLYNEGRLGIVQGVSYPSPNFSHFRASDIWMTAVDSDKTATSGWAGRYLDQRFPNYPDAYPTVAMPDPPAIQIGYVASTTLLGPTDSMTIVVQDPDTFARLVGDKPNDPGSTAAGYAGAQVAFIRQQQASSVSYAAQIKTAADKTKNLAPYPTPNALADRLKIVARLIAGGLQTKLYYVTINGFDTHASQVEATDTTLGTHANLLRTLSDAITAFQADLTQLKVADRVVGMTFSEFGRRALSNGSRGTDHGTSAPMFVFGAGIKTQMVGRSPNLSDLTNNNLKMQTDFRQVYAAMLTDWFGADPAAETAALFRDFTPVPIFRGEAVTGLEPSPLDDARVYPNPTTAELSLELPTAQAIGRVRLVDAGGRAFDVRATQPDPRSLRVNVSGLPPGGYLLHVETGVGVVSRRVQVIR